MSSMLAVPPIASRAGKYLTFGLGHEEYGIEILKVREIIGYMELTAIPNAAPNVKGVINLRGQVIPVADARSLFGMLPVERTEAACIIVIDVQGPAGSRRIGLLVDRVSEVLDIAAEAIEEAPPLGKQDTTFLRGMAKVAQSVKILLDLDAVLAPTFASCTL